MSLFKILLELTDVNKLTSSPEFNAIKMKAPRYAKALVTAWEGDTLDLKKSQGKKIEFLFPKMLTDSAIKKFAPEIDISPALHTKIEKLKHIHFEEFPSNNHKPEKIDTSVWQDVKWAKESLKSKEQILEKITKTPFEVKYETQEGDWITVTGTVTIAPDMYSTGDSPTDYDVHIDKAVDQTGKRVTLSKEDHEYVEEKAIHQANS